MPPWFDQLEETGVVGREEIAPGKQRGGEVDRIKSVEGQQVPNKSLRDLANRSLDFNNFDVLVLEERSDDFHYVPVIVRIWDGPNFAFPSGHLSDRYARDDEDGANTFGLLHQLLAIPPPTIVVDLFSLDQSSYDASIEEVTGQHFSHAASSPPSPPKAFGP